GYYNPLPDSAEVKIDEEKALKWLKTGAIPTDTVNSLLSKAGILKKMSEK
ncbi:MAG: 30S ribosomal protein S16, partial [Deferribacterales bacterium]